jgi:hypothetical protein
MLAHLDDEPERESSPAGMRRADREDSPGGLRASGPRSGGLIPRSKLSTSSDADDKPAAGRSPGGMRPGRRADAPDDDCDLTGLFQKKASLPDEASG